MIALLNNVNDTQGPKPKPTGLLGVGPQATVAGITIQPPSTEVDYESDDAGDDVDAKPLTHAELRAKIIQSSSKRDAAMLKSTSKAKLSETQKQRHTIVRS